MATCPTWKTEIVCLRDYRNTLTGLTAKVADDVDTGRNTGSKSQLIAIGTIAQVRHGAEDRVVVRVLDHDGRRRVRTSRFHLQELLRFGIRCARDLQRIARS